MIKEDPPSMLRAGLAEHAFGPLSYESALEVLDRALSTVDSLGIFVQRLVIMG